ncbi:hypothetical protein NST84_11820 [Paenibacillus sp. FSL R7-0345]|uniref:hypothetical protein n=1 Tax=Paenibacillus sp. FSL R7-0345 TaxID=2954535 RepID=UPI003159BEE9
MEDDKATMDITNLSADKVLFSSPVEEEISFLACTNDEVFIAKTCIRKIDFNGNVIGSSDKEIRSKSVWKVNHKIDVKQEMIQNGEFDIHDIYLTENYLYYVKIIDEDNDGLLLENDYLNGEMWRVHRTTFVNDFCFKVTPFYFHRFLSANDAYVVFVSEDRVPDITEIVFYDLAAKKYAVFNNRYEKNWYDYRLVNNQYGEPDYFIYKKVADKRSEQDLSDVQMLKWSELIMQLQWE